MLKFHLFTFLISLFLLQFASNAKKSPDMIVVVTRHGAREPYKSDWDKSWTNSQEVVDPGVEQSYVLGAVLAEAYADLLKDIDMKEVTAYATIKARTEMTLSALLMGLFRERSHDHRNDLSRKDFLMPYIDQDLVNRVIDNVLSTPEVIPNRLQVLHQILATYKPEERNTFEPLDCWLIADSVKKRFGDEVNKKMFAEHEETATKLRKLGYPMETFYDFVNAADIMISRYSDNRPALEGVPYDGEIYKDLSFVLHWWTLYNFVGPELERSVRAYPLYRNMISWFNQRVSGHSKTKVVLIGGHESAMFPFLNLHGIVNATCYLENHKAEKAGKRLPYPDCINPDFASQLIYELYDVNGTAPYVKMLYNGKAFKICPDTEGVECPLSEFERMFPLWTSHLTEEAYQGQCTPPEVKAEAQKIKISNYLPFVTGLLGVMIGLLPYCLRFEKGRFHEYAKNIKKTGWAFLKPKFTHAVMTNYEEENGDQNSEDIETNERKGKKDIVSP